MRRWAFFLICVIYALFLKPQTAAFGIEEADSYILADLSYEVCDDYSRIIIVSNSRLDHIVYDTEGPYRIVIDPVGVYFCELEEHIELSEGTVASIDVIKMDNAECPEGLDKFFYAVDSIILTLREPLPYMINESDDGKLLLIDVGGDLEKLFPETIEVSQVQTSKTDMQILPGSSSGLEVDLYPDVTEPVIDSLYYEIMDDSSLVIVAATKQIDFFVSTRSYPSYALLLHPRVKSFSELEDGVSFDSGMVKALKIIKDESEDISSPADYLYPIKYILIEPVDGAGFEFYSNDDSTVWIVEFSHEFTIYDRPEDMLKKEDVSEKEVELPDVEEVVEIPILTEKEQQPVEIVVEQYELTAKKQERLIEQKIALEKEDILKQLRDEIKQEEVIKQERIKKARKI
ncbi:MAG: hypothetical protein ABIB11_05810, partial [Candidatus Omnitrophota bacterium]